MNRSFLRNVVVVITSTYTSIFISIILSVILARVLGPEGRGIYAIAISFATIVTYFSSFGLGQSAIYFFKQKIVSRPEVVGFGTAAAVFSAIIGAMIATLSYLFFKDRSLVLLDPSLLLICIAYIAAQHFFGIYTFLLIAFERFSLYAYLAVIRICAVLLMIVLLVCFSLMSPKNAVIVDLSVLLLLSVFLFLWIYYWANSKFTFPSFSQCCQMIKYGIKSYSSSSISYLHFRIDLFIISSILDPRAVGLYALATGLSEKLNVLPSALATVLFPKISAYESNLKAVELTAKALRFSILIALVSGGILFVFSSVLIPLLFSKEFVDSISPFRILLVAAVLFSAVSILESYFKGTGKPFIIFYAHTGGLILNVISNLYLIPNYGIDGAAAACVLSYGFVFVYLVIRLKQLCSMSTFELLVVQRVDIQELWLRANNLRPLAIVLDKLRAAR